MPKYFYIDAYGRKQGPVRGSQLKKLAELGIITPDTPVETESGAQQEIAGRISGLEFPSDDSPDDPPPIPAPPVLEESSPFLQDDEPVFPVIEERKEHSPGPLSRAVYIFLAVFVGVFGIHDFYAKRVRQGWIHLGLLSPWILVFLASILVVFGISLFVLIYAPHAGEIRECKRDIKDVEKNIRDTQRELYDLRQKLEEAKAGRLHGGKEPAPQQPPLREREIPRRQSPPPQDPGEGRVINVELRQGEKEKKAELKEIIIPVKIDEEYVRELEKDLRNMENSLGNLKNRQEMLQAKLASLRVQQGAERIPAWLNTGLVWLYFFLFVLPCLSWAMAMCEIIYVTRDGTGKKLGP